MSAIDSLAPANVEAEQAVLGSLLIDPTAIIRIVATLQPEDFSRPGHISIFATMRNLYARRQAIDLVTVVTELDRDGTLEEAGGPAYVAALIERTPLATHVEHYAGLVERAAMRRRLIDAAGQIARIAYDDTADTIEETIDQAESTIFQVIGDRRRRDLVPLDALLDAYFERIEEIHANRASMLGVTTGFTDLDRLLGGLQPSDLCVVAGRPGMGKTSWLLSVATNIAMAGHGVALFSLEMSAEQIVQRMISSETGISSHKLRVGDISDSEIELVMRAIGRLAPLPFYIDDTPGITPFELRNKVRRLASERGVDLVVVDYLQLMHGGRQSENRVQEISLISRHLKGLAREVRVPVIAASQLSRAVESRADRRPQLSDLRESGCLTADTRIYRADTGEWVPIGDLYQRGERDIPVLTLDAHQKLVRGTMTHVFPSGTKPVYRLRLRSGREIKASGNHPFLTMGGWRALDDLAVGQRLAVSRLGTFGPLPRQRAQSIIKVRLDNPARAAAALPRCAGEGIHVMPSAFPESGDQHPVHYFSAAARESPLPLAGEGWPSGARPGRGRKAARQHDQPARSPYCQLDAPVHHDLCLGDLFWDEVAAIEPLGEEAVFDATVPDTHNFVANGIVVHNSIEQDSDMVLFLYRDAVYNEDTDKKNIAEVHVAKHRHGPTGTVELVFVPHETRFRDLVTASTGVAAEPTW